MFVFSVKLTMALIAIVTFVVLFHTVAGHGCSVNGNTMRCVGTNLTTVPKIPAYIRQLIFTGNDIPIIDSETFSYAENITAMEIIVFSNNNIVNITADAFDHFSNLYSLDLSSNKFSIDDLKCFLKNISIVLHLEKLYLNSISTRLSIENLFSELTTTPCKTLFMHENGIVVFPTKALARLKYIQELSLDRNHLSEITLIRMESLQAFRLNHNRLTEVPTFCDQTNNSFTPALKVLIMNYNALMDIKVETFMCLPNVYNIQLKRNFVSLLRNGFLQVLPNLISFDIGTNAGPNTRIERHAFQSSTLVHLHVGFLCEALEIFESLTDTFGQLPALKTLVIENINMQKLTDEMLKDLFSPPTNLTVIKCINCYLSGDPKYILGHKPMLKLINLELNAFETFSPGLFTNLQYLKELYFRRNKIGYVPEQYLPVSLLNKLDGFDFSLNPFICDCNINWFVNWLKNTNKSKLRFYPDLYICSSPNHWKGRMLPEVHYSYIECHAFTTPEWMGIIGGPSLILIISLVIILYQNRWNIKHYIYLMRKRKQYTELRGQNYEYDVFIAYHHADSKFVVNVLSPMLEGEMNLKLCIHDRDFHAGMFINDNIVEFMNKSRRVLLVLSNNFATSGWCMFELKLAHSLLVEQGVDVIVVMLEDIHGKNMAKPLKVLLNTTTYLEWTDKSDAGRELFINKLKDSFGQ